VDWYDGLDAIIRKLIEEIEEGWVAVEQEREHGFGIQRNPAKGFYSVEEN
jgi:hypothetical protein